MVRRKPRHSNLPYSPQHMKLLENALDSLDRLFDNESTAVDVYTILFATASAMADTDMHELLSSTSNELHRIIRTGPPASQAVRDQALDATDKLRGRLAEVLPFLT
ncbi:hypothetical protein [Bremerella alba]|uniref:Uncharacterized protein n=1 Tax=Bremerella alba TaxID=980252 RepID=A0A7V9A788_9BACT|nr:hypothetical protein [Bremerella alba]MBA2115088.1 hypothetical protein [Bremerella alba]